MTDQVPLVNPTTEDYSHKPPERHQSSEIVTAAAEINFAHKSKLNRSGNVDGGGGGEDDSGAAKELYLESIHSCQTLEKDEVARIYKTSLTDGLNSGPGTETVENLRGIYGPNALTPKKEHPWYVKLLLSIFSGEFNILLWVGSILCFIAYSVLPSDPTNLYLGIVLAVVVTITGIFGYFQESKSSDITASFGKFAVEDISVRRSGSDASIPPRELVPGDLITMKAGDMIPADVRITQCSADAEVNNASLTGESDPIARAWVPEDAAPLEAKNMCFFGTHLMKGRVTGIVVATGDKSFMGTVATLAKDTANVETPIAKEIRDFVHKVSAIAGVLGVAFFIVGYINNGDLVRNLVFLIGIIVANVPEGLLATVTVSLTLTATRMAYKNVQVKNLESVETLGSTSVICSDKTGTLTTSIMTVKHVMFDLNPVTAPTAGNCTLEIDGKGTLYDYDGDMPRLKPSLHRLLRIGLLCNNAKLVYNEDTGEKKIIGDATESAVFKYCNEHVAKSFQAQDSQYRQEWAEQGGSAKISATQLYRDKHEQMHQIPFNSSNKWQVSIHKQEAGVYTNGEEEQDFEVRPVVVLKGAPEKVLDMCTTFMDNGEEKELTAEIATEIVKQNEFLAKQGERVLGFADLELDPEEYDVSLPEPVCIPAPDEMGDVEGPGILVRWSGEEAKEDEQIIFVRLENQYTKGDRQGETKDVLDHTFKELYHAFAEEVGEKAGSIRIATSDKDFADYEIKLKDAEGVKFTGDQASILSACKGPYRFIGTGRNDANWPFGRPDKEEPGLCFVGFYAMIDPPRATVPGAVLKCKEAGIKVIMVTGDHPTTANAIAKQVNIVGKYDADFNWAEYNMEPQEYHMSKQDIADYKGIALNDVDPDDPRYKCALVPGQMSKHTRKGWTLQEQQNIGLKHPEKLIAFWNEVLTKESVVFARTSPEQKLRIVEACQLRGGIVAVTGDGVNDSPALKKADIGVAMGITGTDVAKETADMILKDDNFASIVNGVEEGRIIFDNLKKSIAYTLSSNIPEISPFIMYQLLMIPLPLSTVMILLVDLGTDLAPAISLAHEDSELDIMERSPRDQGVDKLVTMRLISFSYLQIGCIQALAGFYAYFCVLWSYGLRPEFLLGLDQASLYEWKAYDFDDGKSQIDGFWLYCFKDDHDCLYAADPSNFNCHWDDGDNNPWDEASDEALPNPKDRSTPGCQNTKDEDKKTITFSEWYYRDKNWDNKDIRKKIADVYKAQVMEDTFSKQLDSTNCTPLANVGGNAAENKKVGVMRAMWKAVSTYDAAWATVNTADDTFQIYEAKDNTKCKEGSDNLAADVKGYHFEQNNAPYRRNPAAYAQFYASWDQGFGEANDKNDGKDCGVGSKGCAEEPDMYRAYTVALYELLPYETYRTSVYPERDCWAANAEGFSVDVGATNYYTNNDPGTSEVTCDKFTGLMNWNYWEKQNRDCTLLAACEDDFEDLGGHTFSSDNSDVEYGTLFPMTMTDRYFALRRSNTAYFISIIVVQWADLMICKTRVRSLFEQGMTNVFMNYSLFFETALGALLVYFPVANQVCATAPLKFVWWAPAIPFSILIYTYDELRKGYIRLMRKRGSGSWVERNTYW